MPVPIHIGLMGHIDAGKTAVARALSELVSTAGLDKHHQSQERGITIDLGFTFFQLDQYMITLVDAPGHADLIRSVVSGANIIDLAFIIVDGTKGPQVQTGEHLIILDALQIPKIMVLLNKIDMITPDQIATVTQQIRNICSQTRFGKNVEIFPISALQNIGFENLKTNLLHYIQNHEISRNIKGEFKFPIDHHFAKKGQGTILTGTVIRGQAKIGDRITILPEEIQGKIKSIQRWKTEVSEIAAGDRCGVAVSEVDPNRIYRGCVMIKNPTIFRKGKIFQIEVQIIPLFRKETPFGLTVTVIHGMMALNGRLYPFEESRSGQDFHKLRLDPDSNQRVFNAILWLEVPENVEMGDRILLTRLDLPPTTLRIMGTGIIKQILEQPINFTRYREKTGQIRTPDYSPTTAIVEGLTDSIEGGRFLIGKAAESPFGLVRSTFGSKGLVEIEILPEFRGKILKNQEVFMKIPKFYPIDYEKAV